MESKGKSLITKLSWAVFLLAFTANCTSGENDIDLSSVSDINSTAPLTIEIISNYSGSTATTSHSFNETGTTTCSATDSSTSVTCTADLPETQLFLSDVTFQITFQNTCAVMIFTPYTYLASTSATYTAPGATSSIDCSGTTLSASCYGGAAPQIVPSFPSYSSVYATPTDPYTQKTYTVSSANSLLVGSNRLITNDLAAGNVGNTYTSAAMGSIGDGYEPNSLVDYYISCQDSVGAVLYEINLDITDNDGTDGNDFLSFDAL